MERSSAGAEEERRGGRWPGGLPRGDQEEEAQGVEGPEVSAGESRFQRPPRFLRGVRSQDAKNPRRVLVGQDEQER
eukprot:589036-Hanusia_phi.AAC.2